MPASLSSQDLAKSAKDAKAICTHKRVGLIVGEMGRNWQIGTSRVFLKDKCYHTLRVLVEMMKSVAAETIQKMIKGKAARLDFVKTKSAIIMVQASAVFWRLRRRKKATIRLQKMERGRVARK